MDSEIESDAMDDDRVASEDAKEVTRVDSWDNKGEATVRGADTSL